jgi:hypothetical protein
MCAVFLTLEFLCVLSLLAVVDLQSIIRSGYYCELARVVEIERRHAGLALVGLEPLVFRVNRRDPSYED